MGLSVLALCMLGSCAEDAPGNPRQNLEEEGIFLEVRVPAVSSDTEFGMTRADGDLTESELIATREGNIRNLYVVTFSGDASNRVNRTFKLMPDTDDDKILNTTGWRNFTAVQAIPKNLTYTCYVLANFENYVTISGGASSFEEYLGNLSETAVKNLYLDFTGKVGSTTVLNSEELPMAAWSNRVNITDTKAENTSSTVTVTETAHTLYAVLSFLCAKVRYTILFDHTQPLDGSAGGFSQYFPSNDVNFPGGPAVSRVCSRTYWGDEYIADATLDYRLNATGNLQATAYPAAGSRYLDNSLTTQVPQNLSTSPGDIWEAGAEKRAWQGIVYLPENKESDYKTVLSFSPSSASYPSMLKNTYTIDLFWSSGDNYWTSGGAVTGSHGLERGNMYDVVARLENPEAFTVSVNVRVNPWTYLSSVSTW